MQAPALCGRKLVLSAFGLITLFLSFVGLCKLVVFEFLLVLTETLCRLG
jgi:hypothetical protein